MTCQPRLETHQHHITREPMRFLVFDTTDFMRNGKPYRITATRLAEGLTYHTVKNEAGERREMEMQEMIKWLGTKPAGKEQL